VNSSDKEKKLFSFLLNRSIDGDATVQEIQQMNTLLAAYPDIEEYYLKLMQVQSALREVHFSGEFYSSQDISDGQFWAEVAEYEKTAPAIEIPREQPQRELVQKVVYPPHPKRKISKFNLFTLAASAAAMLLLVLFLKFAPERRNSIEVATLVDQMNTEWGDPAVGFENGCRLWTNDYSFNLKKGLLSIAYDQGVKIVVEGPALFEIERSGIFLEYGRMYSQVSEAGTGFTVNTPGSQFVDMGTEFGVQAEFDGSTELHVTRGKVQLFAGADGQSKTSQTVTEDEAVRYNAKSGLVKDIRIKKNAFVRKISSALNQAWMGSSPYEQTVLETRPLYYWRFDGDGQGLLRDEMNPRLNDEYKLFGSPGYSDGPDLGAGKNVALQLTGHQKDYAVLRGCTDEADNADAFSIAMWIRPEKNVSSDDHIVMRLIRLTDGSKGAGRALRFNNMNRFIFSPLGMAGIKLDERVENLDQTLIRSKPVVVDTWHHVVIAYTKNERVNLYVDGRLEDSQKIVGPPDRLTDNLQWCLGHGYYSESKTSTSFAGSIDEISHYNRELSAQEVKMLYEAVGQK
jgi:hypothetical protein